MRPCPAPRAPRWAALALAAAACAPKDPGPAPGLEDVNPGSPSFGELISPNDLRGQVSAWYFAHAT
jgi:hypothetical protein